MLKNTRILINRFFMSPAYFILFSVYPVLLMYANNVYGILLVDLFPPLFISFFFALLLFWILQLMIHHSHSSALIVFVNFLAFFYYGHVRNLLAADKVNVRDDVLAVVWLFVMILASMLIYRHGRHWNFKVIAVAMNLMSGILLVFPVMLLLTYVLMRATPLERKIDHTVQVKVNSASPDIYYIILDAYTRSDVMKNKVGYDNSPFIKSLQDMGFYVAECGQSNYGMTGLSLASALNMDYLQNLSESYKPASNSLLYTFQALDSNAFRNTLTDAGYETITFASGFTWVEWRDADYFISPSGTMITEFDVVVLLSTYARILHDFGIVDIADIHAEHYRQRTRLVLNSFDDLLNLPSPKFVFIHIIAPHPPYGLGEDGSNVMPGQVDDLTGYQNQAKFISTSILPQLKKLINGSANPPVIILQGDHGRLGSDPEDIMTILNAYYLPGHADQLYPSISPVNTFRVVLNSYFGTSFPLLEDVSYYSSSLHNYDFAVVPNSCP